MFIRNVTFIIAASTLMTAVLPGFTLADRVTLRINKELAEQLPSSQFDLYLLSTVTGSEANEKAVLKNPITEEISSYRSGEKVDIIENQELRIVRIFPCMGVIKQNDRYFKIRCKSQVVDNYYFRPESLYGYRIDDPQILTLPGVYDRSFDRYIIKSCNRYGVDPYLVKAVIKAESNFDPNAVSPKNAQGLMQITPPTAEDFQVDDSFDPSSNIDGGVRILKSLIDEFDGDLKLALAAYNAGKYAVIKYGNKIPPYPETQQYVIRVMDYYENIKTSSVN